MASKWCVSPEEVKVDITLTDPETGNPEQHFIRIKKRLTVGEQRRVQTAGWRGVSAKRERGTGEIADEVNIGIDFKAQSFARTEAYLLGWSLTDEKGKPLPHTLAGIEALAEPVFEVIENAITAHIEAVEQEKKVMSGSGG